jgi:polysaccharide biosynthesis transport protein
MAEHEQQRSSALRSHLQVIWRRRWFVLGVFVVFVAVSMTVSFLVTPQYSATAQLRYAREPDITSALNGSTAASSPLDTALQLSTTAKIIQTREMADLAAEPLGLSGGADINAVVTAAPIEDTSLLDITAVSPDPATAAAVANAYAQALVDYRRKASLDKYSEAQQVISNKLKVYRTELQRQDPAYGALQYRLQDVLTLKALATGDFQVASAALVPSVPFRPNHVRDLLVALILGSVVAIGSAFIAEQLDVRLRDADSIVEGLQLPVIGRIPEVSREVVRNGGLVVALDPTGRSAEAFRILRGNLDFIDLDKEVSSLIITSASPEEGKTSTAGNLAISMARVGKRVVVVDVDLRRPRVHRYFGVDNDLGVTSVVAGRASLSESLQAIVVAVPEAQLRQGDDEIDPAARAGANRLYVLPSGPLPPNPGDIVISKHFDSLIADLEAEFDMVLIDTPPFIAVGDAASLARRVDGVLLVARMGSVTRSNVKEARRFLEQLPCRKMGVALTNISVEAGYYGKHRRAKNEEVPEATEAIQGV